MDEKNEKSSPERGESYTIQECYEEYAELADFDGKKSRFLVLTNCEGTQIGLMSLIRVLFDKLDGLQNSVDLLNKAIELDCLIHRAFLVPPIAVSDRSDTKG